jgi:hypothetical protein
MFVERTIHNDQHLVQQRPAKKEPNNASGVRPTHRSRA